MENLYFWQKLFFRLEGDFRGLEINLRRKISFAKEQAEKSRDKIFFLSPLADLFPWSKATRDRLRLETLIEQHELVCDLIVHYEKIEKSLQQREYRLAYRELDIFKAICRNQKKTLQDLRRGCVSYLALIERAEELSKAVFARLVGETDLGSFAKAALLN